MSVELSLGIGSVGMLVVILVITWYIRRENNKDYAQMQLNAPLLVSEILNREEAAAKYMRLTVAMLKRARVRSV